MYILDPIITFLLVFAGKSCSGKCKGFKLVIFCRPNICIFQSNVTLILSQFSKFGMILSLSQWKMANRNISKCILQSTKQFEIRYPQIRALSDFSLAATLNQARTRNMVSKCKNILFSLPLEYILSVETQFGPKINKMIFGNSGNFTNGVTPVWGWGI